jgi:hypothetical protein
MYPVTKPLDAFRYQRFEHLSIIAGMEYRLATVAPQHDVVETSGQV